MKHVQANDVELFEAIELERGRQNDKIELIASENFVTETVMEAQGSVLTNKYAEGIQRSATTVVVSLWISLKT